MQLEVMIASGDGCGRPADLLIRRRSHKLTSDDRQSRR